MVVLKKFKLGYSFWHQSFTPPPPISSAMTNNNKKPSVIDKLDPKTQTLLVVLEIHLLLLASQVTSSHLTKKFHKTQQGKTKLNTKHCIVSMEHLDLLPGGSNFYTLKIHHQHQGGRRKTKNENDAIFPTKFATFLLHFDAI